MKTLITLIAIAICSHLQAQYGNNYTTVTILPNNQIRITNGQGCPTGYAIRNVDQTFDTTGVVQPGESILREFSPCGWGQVIPLISCGVEAKGVEFYSCLQTLPVEEKIDWTQSGNVIEVWLPVGMVVDKTKPQKVRVGLADGSYRVIEFPLTNKIGNYFYYKLKL